MRDGDQLVAVAGVPVKTVQQFGDAVAAVPAGEQVPLAVARAQTAALAPAGMVV